MSSILVSSVGTWRTGSERLVEEDHARKLREALDVIHEERLVPPGEQVGERAADEDEVDRPLADDLVGDRNIAAARVLDVRDLHARSVPLHWPRWLRP